ncbi:MAG: PKD domain-containing protein, partial [Verrucomicrobiales bacterium]|nr:PKD domain-containing protein [Verrucomicrobiales bacterium]
GGYAGIAQGGGRKAHLQSTSLRTAGHEYGHNFGLGHAYYNYTTALRPTGQSAFNGERPLVEYGHRFSIQSAQSGGDFNNPALPQFTVHEKNRLDWLTDVDYADITGSAGAGLYRIYRNDHIDATGIQALRLPARSEGTNNRRYWVSYRAAWAPPVRSSENAYLTNGVVIDWTRNSGSYSTLLDLTPYSDDGSHRSSSAWTRDNDDKWDAALLLGRTFSDPEAGVHVTPVGRGGSSPGEYLDVYVHIDGEREEVWVADTAPCRAVVPDAGTAVGLEWTAVGFDDSGWPEAGALGVGYENGNGYQGFIGTDVGAAMSRVRESCYVRVPFEVADPAALAGLGSLTLKLRYDDGFIAYLNGVKIAEANAPTSPEWDSGATGGHSDSAADDFVDFVVGDAATGALRVGGNVLAIHGLNDGLGSSDFLIQPQLVASFPTEVNGGPAVELVADRGIAARADEVVFTAMATDPDGDELVYAWHFGEGDVFAGEGLNSATAAKAWGSDGEYVVQVTVSDRRGGVARDQMVVKIGDVGGAAGQVRGRVLAGGLPVAGVRVWSGDVQTFSADDGSYVLGGLGAGDHEVRAMADGEVFGATVGMPVVVEGVVSGVDFWAFGSDSNLAGGGVLTVSPAGAEVDRGVVVPLVASWWVADAVEDLLVGSASGVWSFLDDGSDQGAGWRAVGFDDSGWAVGAAPLGYGESGLGTEVGFGGDVSNRHTTTYFRRQVVVAGADGLSRAMLRVRRDDAVVVYVNGTEVMRDNIRPGDSVTASREAFNEVDGGRESEVLVVDVPVELLGEGVNVIAAEVHQESGDSNDLYFDLELVGRRNVEAAEGVVWSVEPESGASVSAAGEFMATAAGVYVVTATVDGQAVSTRMVVASDVEVSVVAVDGVAMEWDTSGGLVRIERSDAVGVLEVELAVGGAAEEGSDYVGLPASVVFADGETVVELPVVVVDDGEPEGFETVNVGVVADGSFRVGATGMAAVWIEDDDADPAPLVTITEPVVEAGASVEVVAGQPVGVMASVVDADVLVARGSGWRYLDLGQPAPAGWVEGEFADVGWAEGLAKFGYGDGNETTTVDFGGDSGAKYITTYFRKRFEVGRVAEVGVLTARLLVDDGAVVYLNGAEVLRQNMPGGEIRSTTRAGSSVGGERERVYSEFDLPVGALVEGVNVIAVEVHQNSPTSSDLGFDLELEGERSGVVAGVVLEWVAAGGVVGDAGAYATEVVFGEEGTTVLRVTADDGGGGEAGMDEVMFEVSGVSYAAWIAGYGVPVAVQGERADADGDGVENLVEFALGMDGAAVDSGVPVESVPGGDWQVSFVRWRGGVGEVGDYLAAGVRYRLWLSDDGANWVLGGEALAVIGSEDSGDGYETVTVEVDAGAIGLSGEAVLFKIEISN